MKVTVIVRHGAVDAVRVAAYVIAVVDAVGFTANDWGVLGPGQGLGDQIDFCIHFRFNLCLADLQKKFQMVLKNTNVH